MRNPQAIRSALILGGAAAFAMAWAISRAVVQSITVDEAMTYNIFVYNRLLFLAHTNNHILNSLLMYMCTKVLGVSQFTARLPALIGAALYITAAYRLCRLLGGPLISQVVLLVCLVYNPFIFDYLVAARGYGLALGFLLWAIVYSAEWHLHQRGSLFLACAVSSTCAGLSIDSNLPFAFVNLVIMTAILLCAWYRRPKQFFRVVTSCVIPGAVVTALVSGYSFFYHWDPGQFNGGLPMYGAHSLSETFGSIIESSLFQTRFDFLKAMIFPLAGVTGLIWLVYLLFQRVRRTEHTAWLVRFAVILAAIFAVTTGIHWVTFYTFGLPLPEDRTAIFFFLFHGCSRPACCDSATLSARNVSARALPVGSGSDGLLLSPVSPADVFQGVVLGCRCGQSLLDSLLSQPDASDHACDFYLVISRPSQFLPECQAHLDSDDRYEIRSGHNASLRGGHSAFPGSSEN